MKKRVNQSSLKTIAVGILLDLIMIFVLSILCGVLIVRGMVPESWIGIVSAVVVLVAGLSSEVYIMMNLKEKKLLGGFAAMCTVLLILILSHAVAMPKTEYGNPWILASMVSAFLIALLMSMPKKGRRRY